MLRERVISALFHIHDLKDQITVGCFGIEEKLLLVLAGWDEVQHVVKCSPNLRLGLKEIILRIIKK